MKIPPRKLHNPVGLPTEGMGLNDDPVLPDGHGRSVTILFFCHEVVGKKQCYVRKWLLTTSETILRGTA